MKKATHKGSRGVVSRTSTTRGIFSLSLDIYATTPAKTGEVASVVVDADQLVRGNYSPAVAVATTALQ